MSPAESTLQRSPAAVETVQSLFRAAIARVVAALRGVAFWLTIPLPLVIVGTLVTGEFAAAPRLVGGLVVTNVICVSVGHRHSPRV